MQDCRPLVPRGGWWVVGLIAVLVGWSCVGDRDKESDIPVFTLVMDGFGLEVAAEDSTALQRLEAGEWPVRYRMVVCGEVLLDEVISSREQEHGLFLGEMDSYPRPLARFLAELQASDPDSLIADWADWAARESMRPAERDEWNAELGRLKSLLLHPDALDTISSKALAELLPITREAECEWWLADLEGRLKENWWRRITGP